jgi:hypothetical protein
VEGHIQINDKSSTRGEMAERCSRGKKKAHKAKEKRKKKYGKTKRKIPTKPTSLAQSTHPSPIIMIGAWLTP